MNNLNMTWPTGVLTALATPFTNGEVDLAALTALIEDQIAADVGGLVVGGGTGEFRALSVEERQRLADEIVRVAAGRVPVIVQTGAEATREVLALSDHAGGVGADGILVASPFGEALAWREKHTFFETVATAVDLPIMIYNTTPAGILTLEQIATLAELEGITAIKESSYDMLYLGDVLAWAADEDKLAVYVGADSLTVDAVRAGALGTLTGMSNFLPAELGALVELGKSGLTTAEGAALWRSIRALSRFMETTPNYVAWVKLGCARRGVDVGLVRPPYLMPAEDDVSAFTELVVSVEQAFASLTESPERESV